jgi:hypothetical protein
MLKRFLRVACVVVVGWPIYALTALPLSGCDGGCEDATATCDDCAQCCCGHDCGEVCVGAGCTCSGYSWSEDGKCECK